MSAPTPGPCADRFDNAHDAAWVADQPAYQAWKRELRELNNQCTECGDPIEDGRCPRCNQQEREDERCC